MEATSIILTPPKHDPISITSVYIPPSSDENMFTIDVEYFLQTASNCVLFGDFNATHNAWNCNINTNRGQPIGVNVHCTQYPIREQPSALSQAKNPKQPSTQMKIHSHASWIPLFDQSPSRHSAECKPPLSSCPASKTCHDMGLRIVLQSRCPKRNAHSTPFDR
ncbi:hypothetical protein TNCV_3483761 [Trichonephila clavipes]|nr:hypothetical protein TNCV_3483761 [Trichonephila clavipes]